MKDFGQSHHSIIRVHHWVLGWTLVGIIGGFVAVVNIVLHHLTRSQEDLLLIMGVVNWVLLGVICWAAEGIQVQMRPVPRPKAQPIRMKSETEWHAASEFRLPGGGKMLIRFPYAHSSHETLAHYGQVHFRERHSS